MNTTLNKTELKRLVEALRAAKNGDFSARFSAATDSGLGEVAVAFNELAERQERFAFELQRVSRVIGREGRMTERASLPGAAGPGEATEAVNELIDDLVRPTTEVARVIDAVADGDLAQKMALKIEGRPVKGEFLRIGTTVNAMVDQLSSFADEVTRVAREVGTEGKLGGQAEVKGVVGHLEGPHRERQLHGVATSPTRCATSPRSPRRSRTATSQKITVDAKGEVAAAEGDRSTRWSTSSRRSPTRSRAWPARSAPRASSAARPR